MRKRLGTRLLAGIVVCALALPLVACGGINSADLKKGVKQSSEIDTQKK